MRNEISWLPWSYAPGTHIAVTNPRNRSVAHTLLPFERQDLLDAGVDLDQKTRAAEWVERPVLQPDVAVHAMPTSRCGLTPIGTLAPDFHHTGQEVVLPLSNPWS